MKTKAQRICIIGTHGTGKTTLATRLSQTLEYPMIPDVVIEGKKLGMEADEKTTPETQSWFASHHLSYERGLKKFVSDKALWDFFVYAKVIFKNHQVLGELSSLSLKNANYDHVFYLPIEFELEDNGLRSLDLGFQKLVDKVYQEFLMQEHIPYQKLSGSADERMKQALAALNLHA